MTFTRKATSLALILCAMSATVSADFVGLNIGVGQWMPDISGSLYSTDAGSSSRFDLNSDLGYSNDTSNSFRASFEHPIPMLPNLKYQGVDLNSTSNSTLNSTLTFDNKTYNINDKISSTLDLSHKDVVLYYELLDNWINLDVGLDLKKFDGKVSISDTNNNSSSITVDETIPMLYLSARVDLPFSGLYVGANIQQLSVGDSSAKDTTLMIGYESSAGLGVEGGIKTFNLDLNNVSNLNTNLQYDGLFLNGYYHF